MSRKKEIEIEQKADSAEWALKQQGVYHLPNDEPGLASSVAALLRRRFPNSDLEVETPPRNFGGEYTFRSKTYLGKKSESAE